MEYVTHDTVSGGDTFKTRCGLTAYVGSLKTIYNVCNWCYSIERKVIGVRATIYPKKYEIKEILGYCAIHEAAAMEAQEQTQYWCKSDGLGHFECFKFKESIPMLFRGEE